MQPDKKAERKLKKSIIAIQKEHSVDVSEEPTKYVLISNVGLITGNSREDIIEVASQFGQIDDVIMVPGKSYSFVVFCDPAQSQLFSENVNGKRLPSAADNRVWYLSFIKSLPDLISSRPKVADQLPAGLHIIPDFVTEDEERNLLTAIDWGVDCGQLKHRRVKHYGYAFMYETNDVERDEPLQQSIPLVYESIICRLLETGHVNDRPDQMTVNQYKPGQGIPPHVDTHSAFEEPLVSISLGSSIHMEFYHPDGRHISVSLPRRCCVIMLDESRYVWKHGITPRKLDVIKTPSSLTLQQRGERTSLTFRKVRWTPCDCPFPEHCDSQMGRTADDIADVLENTHVFKVYEEIAPHFSDTRHKPWPEVLSFVKSLPAGSILVDVGCGNGKYLGHTSQVFELGCDRSHNLLSLCHSRGCDVFPADCRNVPLRSGIADACICIAVIHHLATPDRRLQAISEMVRLLRVGGQALIYVWAREQRRGEKKSTYLLQQKKEEPRRETSTNTLLPVHQNRTDFEHADVLVPWKLNPKTASLKDRAVKETVFHRFYHVFTEGELEDLCGKIPNAEICKSYYDQGNWCVILEKSS